MSKIKITVLENGNCQCLYQEDLNLKQLGSEKVTRLSFVEPCDNGTWMCKIIGGITKQGFTSRSEALIWEKSYANTHII